MFKSKRKSTRSNLAALIAIIVVATVASIPVVGTMLEGGPDSVAAAMQVAQAAAISNSAAGIQVASK